MRKKLFYALVILSFFCACEDPELSIRDISIIKVSNATSNNADIANFLVVFGSGFDVSNANTISFTGSASAVVSNKTDFAGEYITVVIPSDAADGSITITTENDTATSTALAFSAIDSIEDIEEPTVTINYIIKGIFPGQYDVNFTIFDDTAVTDITTDSASNISAVSHSLYSSGTYDLENVSFDDSATTGTMVKIYAADVAGHVVSSNEVELP